MWCDTSPASGECVGQISFKCEWRQWSKGGMEKPSVGPLICYLFLSSISLLCTLRFKGPVHEVSLGTVDLYSGSKDGGTSMMHLGGELSGNG